jgi:hypothetical protein
METSASFEARYAPSSYPTNITWTGAGLPGSHMVRPASLLAPLYLTGSLQPMGAFTSRLSTR